MNRELLLGDDIGNPARIGFATIIRREHAVALTFFVGEK